MTSREEELEEKLKTAEHSLMHAVQKLGGELRYRSHDTESHTTGVTTTTHGDETVVTVVASSAARASGRPESGQH